MIATWDRARLAALPSGQGRDLAAAALDADPAVTSVVIHRRRPAPTVVEIKGGDLATVQAAVTAAHPELNALVADYREALT